MIVLVQVCVSDPDGHWPQVPEKSVKEPHFLDLAALYKFIFVKIFFIINQTHLAKPQPLVVVGRHFKNVRINW